MRHIERLYADGRELRCWGVPWQPSRGAGNWTATDRAVVSRSLRRLEQRGLVLRQNPKQSTVPPELPIGPGAGMARRVASDPFWGQTTTVMLLPAGRALLEAQAAGSANNCGESNC